MGFMDEYNVLKKKRKEEERDYSKASLIDRYNELKQLTHPVNLDNIYYDDNMSDQDFRNLARNIAQQVIVYDTPVESLNEYEQHILKTAFDTGVFDAKREATFLDLTWNSFTKGINNTRLGEESFAAMQGLDNDRETYKQILSGDEYNFVTHGWFAEGVSGAFEQLGQLARQTTNPRTLAFTGAASGAAAIAGQIGPQVILPEEIITVPAAAIAALTAGNAASALEVEAGHAYDEMLELGVNPETASKVALAIGTVNAGLETLQVDTLLDAYKIVSKTGAGKSITKRLFDELVARGIDVAKETAQEVMQEGVTMAGVQIAHQTEKGGSAFSSDEVKDRLLDTAKHSALSFGMMNVPAATKNIAVSGYQQSTTNKLTDNEQKVVDKVVEDEIADREKDGKKLSSSEKSAIKKDVITKLEKGYIPIQTIEDVLGDRSSYDSLVKEAEEYDTLYNTASGQLSKAQQDRLAELEAKNKANPYKDALQNAKDQQSQNVFELANGTRLSESYNERARRSQDYKADLTKYDEKQRETVQRAIDSGILNNTNRTHDFVDMVAKVSADKGVLFDFTNNEKLKGSVFAVEGKIVNGYFDKASGTVGVNIDSAKALNTVVGHEITHVLEGTELYDAMKQTLFEYAKSKGEYQSRYDALVELYKDVKDVKDADIEAELAADLVGDYLFTDADFINHLSTKNRNVFQKIYDELMYLYKIATSGSKEAIQLEKVKKAFEKAYREVGKAQKNTADGGVKYKLSDIEIDRTYIDYTDTKSADTAVDNKVSDLVERGKIVPLSDDSVANYKKSVDWTDRKAVRALLNGILEPNLGVSVVFEHGKQGVTAYLTRNGINHAVGGPASPNKAAAFEMFSDLVKNSEYAYSSQNHQHSNNNKKIDGEIVWDTFVAVGSINGKPYPVTFKIRSVDSDIRSQIYAMATKNETGFSHEDGTQENLANAHSNYGTSPISGVNVAQNGENVKHSLSDSDGNYNVSGKDIALEVGPVTEETELSPDTPVAQSAVSKLEQLNQQKEALEGRMLEAVGAEDYDTFYQLNNEYEALMQEIEALDKEVVAEDADKINSLTEADIPPETEANIPPEMDAPYYGDEQTNQVDDPFEDRDWYEVGNKKVKAYMYENPEVKPFFQEEAMKLLGELNDTTRGERWYNDELYYESGGEAGFGGVKRHTSASMEELLDSWGMSYADIEKGLNAIIEDHGAENIAAAKKLEFMLNDRLLNGYKDFYTNSQIPPNQDYINLLNEKQITEYSKESFDALMANADQYAPAVWDDIAPTPDQSNSTETALGNRVLNGQQTYITTEDKLKTRYPQQGVGAAALAPFSENTSGQQTMFEGAEKANETIRKNKTQTQAQILTEEPKVNKKKISAWKLFKDNFVDKGTVFETMSLKTGNRELQAKWKAIGRAESSAQWFMENGNSSTSSLKSIRDTVEKSGKTKQFYEYLYHRHNVDRMNLKNRYPDMENKPVFGYDVTSEMSQKEAAKLETENPEFKDWANDVYSYMNNLREKLVDGGVISAETAKLWSEMYPNYVPIRRVGDEGLNINVALDSKRTGVNAPIKKATGGNSDILPLFDTMAMRTEQTFKAIAKNRFGVELKNMLGTTVENQAVGIDESIDSVETELLQEGKDGKNPTFTVFENGEKVTFEITDEMYDTMKPKSKAMGYTNKFLNAVNNIRRGLLTEYNPAFMLTNPIKDTQDVLINSQHPARTYANYPKAIAELIGKGQYYQEYMENGGQQNTYFDGESKTFTEEKSGLSKLIGFPLEKISQANNFIERVPRMAEYIASRKEGRSIDSSMLDAARVTTDFSAGGDLVKFANRNGFTFLNASVQGAVQQVRNVREAKAAGLKGWAKLAAKASVAGFSALLLNNLMWDDDEEYEELSDYVKQNYYIVGKYGDGKFVRIPKGRALAVIQNAFEQMENLVTGNDEVDLGTFGELVISNLAPNNPLENNLIAPITQAVNNKTWYGEDLVPTRLQDLPTEEQYDETTDAISKWLGEHTPISPYKWNYLLDQYSGAIGDVFLPMITPEAERGNDTMAGNLIAPLADKFTTDGVMKNQNISDFYDKKDELTTNAKSSGATEEDVLMNQYMNSINSELSELYAQKREIQNSDLSNAEKYNAVRDIQKQIVDLTRESLSSYDDIDYQSARDGEYVNIGNRYFKKDKEGEWQKLSDNQVTKYKVTSAAGDSSYASDGTNHYRWYTSEDGDTEGWRKITEKEFERQSEITDGLGISPEDYWNNKDEYSYAYDHPGKYAVAKSVGGYDAYKGYSKDLSDIKSDKDKNGNTISGSRKKKVVDYINGLDADYGEKIILFKSEYPSDDTYNYEIIDYLNSRDDISYSEMETILTELGFKVYSDGTITWG